MKKEILQNIKHSWMMLKDFIHYSFVKSKGVITENKIPTYIMSFNLRKDAISDKENCWQFRKKDVVDFLLNEKPHVVGMQEVMPHMYKYVLAHLGHQYDGYGINNFIGGKLNTTLLMSAIGNAIIWDKSRYVCFDKGHFWLSDKPNKPSATWGNKEPRTCVYVGLHDIITNESFYIYNTHLDHIANNQQKMADLIASKIKLKKNNYNIALMGDFNINFAIPEDRHQLDALNVILTSTYNHIKDLTFNAWHPKLSKTLDAIYFSMNNMKCKVIPSKLSDHLPIAIYKE